MEPDISKMTKDAIHGADLETLVSFVTLTSQAGDEFQGVHMHPQNHGGPFAEETLSGELRNAKIWIVCDVSIFLFGVWLYKFQLRKRGHLAV